jgi:hypothetical protein
MFENKLEQQVICENRVMKQSIDDKVKRMVCRTICKPTNKHYCGKESMDLFILE